MKIKNKKYITMKTLNYITQKNLCAMIGFIMALMIIFNAVANASENISNLSNQEAVYTPIDEQLDLPTNIDIAYVNPGLYQVYIMDENENQVYCGTVGKGSKTMDNDLLKYIRKSDFLMQVDNIIYYRIIK
jgi:hypothetical protein